MDLHKGEAKTSQAFEPQTTDSKRLSRPSAASTAVDSALLSDMLANVEKESCVKILQGSIESGLRTMSCVLWNLIVHPLCTVEEESDRRQRKLVTFGSWFLALSYSLCGMGVCRFHAEENWNVFLAWIIGQASFWGLYIATRSPYNLLAARVFVFLASIIPYITSILYVLADSSDAIGLSLHWIVHPFACLFYVSTSTVVIGTFLLHLVCLSVMYAFQFLNVSDYRFIVMLCSFLTVIFFLYKELLSESLRAKEQFTSNVSHELRTPLNSIIATLELLLDSDLHPRQQEMASIAIISAENMLQLVNDLLTFSRMKHTALEVNKTVVDLRACLNDVIRIFSAQTTVKQISLDTVISQNVPEWISSDGFRIMQILSNFVSNAFKFSPPNSSVRISVSVDKSNNGDFIRFEVQDQGQGISPTQQQRLFQPYSQLHSTTPGTGLGLVISKSLTKMLGGSCGVTSAIGKGSIFWFTIPNVTVVPDMIEDQYQVQHGVEEPVAVQHHTTDATEVSVGTLSELELAAAQLSRQVSRSSTPSHAATSLYSFATTPSAMINRRTFAKKDLRIAVRSSVDGSESSVVTPMMRSPVGSEFVDSVVTPSASDIDVDSTGGRDREDMSTSPPKTRSSSIDLSMLRRGVMESPFYYHPFPLKRDFSDLKSFVSQQEVAGGGGGGETSKHQHQQQQQQQQSQQQQQTLHSSQLQHLHQLQQLQQQQQQHPNMTSPVSTVSTPSGSFSAEYGPPALDRSTTNASAVSVNSVQSEYSLPSRTPELKRSVTSMPPKRSDRRRKTCPVYNQVSPTVLFPTVSPALDALGEIPPFVLDTQHGTVLIAEDNLFNQQVTTMMLQSMNYTAVIANDGAECLQMYTQNPDKYVAILMDCQMPTMDGHEATLRIRAQEKKLKTNRIPIIGLTADAGAANVERCTQVGMDAVLTKPVRKKDLQALLLRSIRLDSPRLIG